LSCSSSSSSSPRCLWSSRRCVPPRRLSITVFCGRGPRRTLVLVLPWCSLRHPLAGVGHAGRCHPPLPCLLVLVICSTHGSSVAPTVHRVSSCSQRWGWVLGRLSLVCLHCPAAGPPVLPWSLALLSRCLPLAVVPVPLLPVSTPRAPARGCGWGYCAGGCHCRSSPSPVPRRPVVVAGRPLIVVPVSTQKRLLVTNR